MLVKSAKFLASYGTNAKMPADKFPEFAFIGRSNVGKSSLINMLCDRKDLAKTSSTPGKTQCINRFLINEKWCLVDLPGYGFAKVSKTKRDVFSEIIADYLKKRSQLAIVFVLIDARIPPQAIDLEFLQWCGENEVPFAIVFTKTDKVKPEQLLMVPENYVAALHQNHWVEFPDMQITSAHTKEGKTELLGYIGEVLEGIAGLV